MDAPSFSLGCVTVPKAHRGPCHPCRNPKSWGASITPSSPTPSPGLCCLPRAAPHPAVPAPGAAPGCCPCWGVLVAVPTTGGLQGADDAHGEGFGLGEFLQLLCCCRHQLCVSLQSCCLTHLPFCGSLGNANIKKKAPFPHSALCWTLHCVWEMSSQLQTIPVPCTPLSGLCGT